MKKTKVIALVLIAAVMLMGAGYAYWQEELTISSTVETGDLKVEFLPLLLDEILDDHGGYDNKLFGKDYINVDADVDSDKISFEVENIYPGAGGFLEFRIANTGTVPAKVTDLAATLKTGTTKDILNKFDYRIHSLRLYIPKFVTLPVGWSWSTGIIYDDFEYIDVVPVSAPISASDFDDFVVKLEDKLDNYILEPYAFFEINGEGTGYDIQMPTTISNVDNMENLQNLGFDLGITFTQGD